jgi:hypothetical protein
MNLSLPIRRGIAAFLRRVFEREQHQIRQASVALEPVQGGGNLAYVCRIRLWSSWLGLVTVRDVGDTIFAAIQQASLRAREVVRRRLSKRRSVRRRASSRLPPPMPEVGVNRIRKEIQT